MKAGEQGSDLSQQRRLGTTKESRFDRDTAVIVTKP